MRNLEAEMARHGVTNADIQKVINCTEKTVQNKKRGSTEFTVSEAISIRDAFFPGMRISYLFCPEVIE